MKSFGIGLALLVSGFTAYLLTSFLAALFRFLGQLKEAGVTLPEGWETLVLGGIPLDVLNIAPYICLGIMGFGIVWFWLTEPIFYLVAPPKKEVKREVKKEVEKEAPSVPSPMRETVEPVVPSGREVERWIAEAIHKRMERGKELEQWIAEAILEKLERERGK